MKLCKELSATIDDICSCLPVMFFLALQVRTR